MNQPSSSAPLVSVVMPTYRRAHLLRGAIQNVLSQTWQNLELIVVDDNSPDDTPAVVSSLRDDRLRYVRNEPNLRLPRALNRGFSLARGHYLTWTSDDNFYAPYAIARMVDELRRRVADFVYTDYYQFSEVDADGRPTNLYHDRLPVQAQLARGNHIGACFMYSRTVYETIGDYDPELFLVEDYDYFIRVAKRFEMIHVAEPLYYFRRDDATLFCSRYSEVQASDVLVRYKNELLDESGVLAAIVNLMLKDYEGLRNPLLRHSRRLLKDVSYRLLLLHQHITVAYLQHRLRARLCETLQRFRSGELNFSSARTALLAILQDVGALTYVPPKS